MMISRVKNTLRAFKISAQQIYQLEASGVLPTREWGRITPEWLAALVQWHIDVRGPVPEEAKQLIESGS